MGEEEEEKKRHAPLLLSCLLHLSLHPLTLSDQLHLIPLSLVYRLFPPGTEQKFGCEYLVMKSIQTLCKLVLLNSAELGFEHHTISLFSTSTVSDSIEMFFLKGAYDLSLF